ncbi:VOC family protein [Streptomyces sp. NPDC052023]|uniref:VOC family protein n=1 Tax=Streptomyces sp. NPDC052023 TaxID=3365681 RepID=UPI0037D13659
MLTTRFVHGAPIWIDVSTSDIDGAIHFYGGLFGWQFRSAGPEAGGYGFFQLDGRTVAGGMQTSGEQGPPSWTVYFHSPDAQATAESARQAHGRVLVEPTDVMGEGHMAILSDQQSVPFGIWQPGRTKGVDMMNESGALCWLELYTPDIAAAAGYYNKLLGWETSAVNFPGGSYTCVNPAGEDEDTMFAGLVPLPDDPSEDTAYWLPYFEVADTDAAVGRARELGGTVRVEPRDVSDAGRVAKLSDPYGARFAVIRSAAPQS